MRDEARRLANRQSSAPHRLSLVFRIRVDSLCKAGRPLSSLENWDLDLRAKTAKTEEKEKKKNHQLVNSLEYFSIFVKFHSHTFTFTLFSLKIQNN